MKDRQFLLNLYAILIVIHKYAEDGPSMRRLMSIIEATPKDKLTPNTSTKYLKDMVD